MFDLKTLLNSLVYEALQDKHELVPIENLPSAIAIAEHIDKLVQQTNIIFCIYRNNRDNTRTPSLYYSKEDQAQKFCNELNAVISYNSSDEYYYVAPILLMED